jgi:hypothetical protein
MVYPSMPGSPHGKITTNLDTQPRTGQYTLVCNSYQITCNESGVLCNDSTIREDK